MGIIISTVLVLGACSPGTSDDAAKPSGGNHLTYVYFTNGPDEQTTRELIKEFEQQTRSTVDLQIVPFSGLDQQLQARISANNAPDVARESTLTGFRDALLDLKQAGQDIGGQYLDETVESGRGAVLALRPVRFPDPLSAPGVRLSPHRALHVSFPLVSCLRQLAVWQSTESGCCDRDSGSESLRRWMRR